MRAYAPLLLAVLLSGCASLRPLSADEMFIASGVDPNWLLSMNPSEISIGIGGRMGRHEPVPESYVFPMVRGRRSGDAYVWESVSNGRRIVVEDRHHPCMTPSGVRLSESIRVRLDQRLFEGCGGRQVPERG